VLPVDLLPTTPGTTGCHTLLLCFYHAVTKQGTRSRLFVARNNTSYRTHDFRQFSTVGPPPCLLLVRHSPGNTAHSDRPATLLDAIGKDCWAAVGRWSIFMPRNVAQQRNHRAANTTPKLTLGQFPVPPPFPAAPSRRRFAHVHVISALEWAVSVPLYDSSNERNGKSCLWLLHEIAPHLLFLPEADKTQ